jgi:hypothetical protein
MMVSNTGTRVADVGTTDSTKRAHRTLIWLSLWGHTFHKYFGMYGGDDGARTRDLCRDRAAL